MAKQNDFEAAVAASNEAQNHAQEIQQTRIGGLGGSDAALVLRIAERGLAGLTETDTKRLCVMCGVTEPDNWSGNAYTHAGHAFEDYAEAHLPLDKGYEREKYLSRELARNFKTFAHADFVTGDNNVVECKFVQKDTAKVIEQYYAQLQWYYMLGANLVFIYHGVGIAEPFEVEEATILSIERDEQTIQMLLAGIKILDEALRDGWKPQASDKIDINDTPEMVRNAFYVLEEVKRQEAELKNRKTEAGKVVQEFIEGYGLTGITADNGDKKMQVIYTRASVTKSFDSVTFLREHPEYNDDPRYWKTTERKASITFK